MGWAGEVENVKANTVTEKKHSFSSGWTRDPAHRNNNKNNQPTMQPFYFANLKLTRTASIKRDQAKNYSE